jgi:DNA-binding HxlR family transcriptional regulator
MLLRKIDRLHADCPIKAFVDVIGGRWKPAILFYLRLKPKRFAELRRQVGAVTNQALSTQLRELEADGLVAKVDIVGCNARTEYALTEYGETLGPLLEWMEQWGKVHLEREREDGRAEMSGER